MHRILIIGYGNPLRGDDGVGWRAADALRDTIGSQPEIEILQFQQLNPELAEPISRASVVIFVDAARPGLGAAAGSILEQDLEPKCMSPGCFSHDLTPPTLLACAAELFGSTPRARIFSIVGLDFGMGEELSPPVSAQMPELISRVRAMIGEATVSSGR